MATEKSMQLYEEDLAYIHANGFSEVAEAAALAVVALLRGGPMVVRKVLDVGCGAGVTTRMLVEAGFESIAIELSESLLRLARAAAPQATFFHGSVYDVDLPACEAILAVGEVLTYHAPGVDAQAAIESFLQRAAGALPVGGLLVFDVICIDGPSLVARGWKSSQDWAVLSDTIEDRDARQLTRTIETFRKSGNAYRRGREVHHVRLFDEREMRRSLALSGFDDVETMTSYGSLPLPPRRVAFIARRRALR